MPAPPLIVRAHAKVNLSLRVGPRRPDGFHPLHTVYQTIDLHDTLRVTQRRGPFALSCRTPGVPADPSNLIWRAAAALWRRLGRAGDPVGVAIHLQKRIPMRAGLGGGSSDAAATLVALNELWRARLSRNALVELAAALGSDVPFFLVGGTALGLGRGELVQPLPDAPPRAVVLIDPGLGVSTAEAYGWFDRDTSRRAGRARFTRSSAEVSSAVDAVNDLEGSVIRRHPEIGAARQALLDAGAETARMSGSGSAVFGMFDRRRAARAACRSLARSGWTVMCAKTLGRAEYRRRARPERKGRGRTR